MLKIFLKKILIIFTLLLLVNCQMISKGGMATFAFTTIKVPAGTPVFQKGYRDGCESVRYSRGNVFYRFINRYKFDAKMTGNPEYRLGHSRGYAFCFTTILSPITGPQSSFDRFINPYGYDSGFSAGNINDTWGGAFDGSMGGSVSGGGFNGIFDVIQKGGSGTGESAFTGNPLWAGGSRGQFFGW